MIVALLTYLLVNAWAGHVEQQIVDAVDGLSTTTTTPSPLEDVVLPAVATVAAVADIAAEMNLERQQQQSIATTDTSVTPPPHHRVKRFGEPFIGQIPKAIIGAIKMFRTTADVVEAPVPLGPPIHKRS